jgi:hypothetical protein
MIVDLWSRMVLLLAAEYRESRTQMDRQSRMMSVSE